MGSAKVLRRKLEMLVGIIKSNLSENTASVGALKQESGGSLTAVGEGRLHIGAFFKLK